MATGHGGRGRRHQQSQLWFPVRRRQERQLPKNSCPSPNRQLRSLHGDQRATKSASPSLNEIGHRACWPPDLLGA